MSPVDVILRRIVIVLMAFIFAACSTRQENTEVTTCVYPDSPRYPAPSFICHPKVAGYPVVALRSSPNSDIAVGQRITELFDEQIRIWAADYAFQWFNVETNQLSAESFLIEFLADKSRVVRSRTSPKSHLWVIIGFPMTKLELLELTYEVVPQEQ